MFNTSHNRLSNKIIENLQELSIVHKHNTIDNIDKEYIELNNDKQNNLFDYQSSNIIMKYVRKGIVNDIYYHICKVNDQTLSKIENYINYFDCEYFSNKNDFSYNKEISLEKLAYIYIIIIPINKNKQISLEILHNPIKKNIINIGNPITIFTTYNNLFQIKSTSNIDIFAAYIYFN